MGVQFHITGNIQVLLLFIHKEWKSRSKLMGMGKFFWISSEYTYKQKIGTRECKAIYNTFCSIVFPV